MSSLEDRHLFPDDQAYIAHKRHMAAMEREETLKQAQARKKRRRMKYSPRILRALRTLKSRKWRAAVYADAERYAAFKARNREKARLWRINNLEKARDRRRRNYQNHRYEYSMYGRIYYQEHCEERKAKWRAWAEEHREALNANRLAWYHAKAQDPAYRAVKAAKERERQKRLRQDAEKRVVNNAHKREYRAQRMQDPLYRQQVNERRRARRAAKKATASK